METFLYVLNSHHWKEHLVCKYQSSHEKKVKFVDDNTLAIEGIGDVSTIRKNDEHSLILYFLYILGIKCNLLSI